MTSKKVLNILLCTPLSGCAMRAAPERAQQAEPDADAAAQSGEKGNSGEIVVTGDRANRFGTDTVQSGSFRNAKVLDVPLTISVIPSEVLKSQQAVDLIDAVRNTAGVSTTGTGPVAYNNLTVRGIAVDTQTNFRLDGADRKSPRLHSS